MADPDEQVLVVPRSVIAPGAGWHGVRRGRELPMRSTRWRATAFFMRRGDAEQDPGHKQVIPYLVLRDGERWFLMAPHQGRRRRTAHDLWSTASAGTSTRATATWRDASGASGPRSFARNFEPAFAPVGLLNDDTTAVGAVHVGVVVPGRCGGSRGGEPRDRQAARWVRDDGGGRRRARRDGDLVRLVFDALRG